MGTLRETILAALQGDAELGAILAGGVHGEPINRGRTPGAFDGAKGGKLKPCVVLSLETSAPDGPIPGCERQFFAVYFYEHRGYANIDAAQRRVKVLLDRRANVDLGIEGLVYEFRHAEDSRDLRDPELDDAPMRFSRYSAVLNTAVHM
jgi:hypothetical protein